MHVGHMAGHGALGAAAAASPRLVNAAHEFEAQMMKELMKPLTSGSDDEDRDDGAGMSLGSGSSGALGEFASEALARALSQQGGFGIADRIVEQLAGREAAGKAAEEAHSGKSSAGTTAAGKDRVQRTSYRHK